MASNLSTTPSGKMRRTLSVGVLAARNLRSAERGGKNDAYAVVSLVDLGGRPITAEPSQKTRVVASTEPTWGSTFVFGASMDILDESLPTVRVEVLDKELIGSDRPLGRADVLLQAGDEQGFTMDSWVELMPFGKLKAGAQLGEIHLVVRLTPSLQPFSAPSLARHTSSMLDRGVFGALAETDELPENAEQAPNLLKLTILQARGIRAADTNVFGKDSSDPLVVVAVEGQEMKTKVIKENLNPVWDETFDIFATDASGAIHLTVEDYDTAVNDFLGSCQIPLDELRHKKKVQKWFPLTKKDGTLKAAKSLGDIEVKVQWYFDPAAANYKRKLSMLTTMKRKVGIEDASSDTEEEGGGNADDEDDADELTEKGKDKRSDEEIADAKKKEEEEKEKLKSELMDIEVKSGDYMIYVHIIEVRDLKGEDVQGTSDPVVTIEAFGQRFATEVKQACLSAVFDETFVISLRNLDKEEFENGVIRVSVMDADIPLIAGVNLKNDLIGAYSFDATYVYFQKGHEIHRAWVALQDDTNPEDSGTQGFLKLSVQIVGPGDKMVVHDEEEDRRKEKAALDSGAALDSMVIMPPVSDTQLEWLVTTFWKAEYLPVMDKKLVGSGGGGDFYCKLRFAGGKPVVTKKKTLKGQRSALNPSWRTELWQPVVMPCMAGNIRYIVIDHDTVGDDEHVGVFHSKLKKIEKCPDRKRGPYWVNLYGPPLDIPDTTSLRALGKQAVTSGVNWEKRYMELPDLGSCYRGRVLVSERVTDTLPAGHEHEKIGWRRKVSKLTASMEPTTKQFGFRIYVAGGTEIPRFKSLVSMGTKNCKMFLKFSMGKFEKSTAVVDNEKGVCEWNQLVQVDQAISLPDDPAQMPDLLVHLMRDDSAGDPVAVSYCRFKAKDLLEKGFNAEPQWIFFKEDKVIDALEDGEFPGNVLLRIGFGKFSEFVRSGDAWNAEARNLGKRVNYTVRFHLYQARDLPACDDNGLLDPYFKINLLGQVVNTDEYKDPVTKKHTMRRRKTGDPIWYQTLDFEVLMAQPELKKYWPQINVQVWDYDMVDMDDFCGTLFLPLYDLPVEVDTNIGPAPLPSWKSFFVEEPGDGAGQILVSMQVIQMLNKGVPAPAAESITPKTRPAFVELIAVGLRSVQPYQMIPLQFPYVEFELSVSEDDKKLFQTASSKKPTGSDANFLQRVHVEVPLPINEIFAPRLKIRAFDVRLGGFLKPLVAVGSIDMVDKLPWSSTYKPPAANPREAAAIAMRESDKRLEQEARQTLEEGGGGVEEKKENDGKGDEKKESDVAATAAAGKDVGAGVLLGVSVLDPAMKEAGQEAAAAAGAGVIGGELGVPTQHIGVTVQVGEGVVKMDEEDGATPAAPPPVDDDEDDDDGPPKYMLGRETLEASLEDKLLTTPFETFPLFRGQGADLKVVGYFKCLFRVTEVDPDVDLLFVDVDSTVDRTRDAVTQELQMEAAQAENTRILNELLMPKGYKVRLYVLRAINLTPMDPGLGGRPGKSDPYLLTKLGKQVVDNSASYVEDVTDADLYQMVEFNTELPGAGRLDIQVMDHDDIGSDELIGQTIIDLEDRWFDQRWQVMGLENRQMQQDDPSIPVRFETKPLEIRTLSVPTSRAPQGVLQCWVDIMNPSDAGFFPPDDVALPPSMDFEVRVIIWKCKDVVNMDEFTSMNDLYVKCWIEGVDAQETDTHWRAKKGKGSFNWRMKFPVSLGPRTRSYKFPYFTIQLWDKDLLYNDVIAEGMIDLGKYFRKAYKKKVILKLFEDVDKRAKMKADKEADLKNMALDVPKDEESQSLLGSGGGGGGGGGGGAIVTSAGVNGTAAAGADDDHPIGGQTNPMLAGEGGGGSGGAAVGPREADSDPNSGAIEMMTTAEEKDIEMYPLEELKPAPDGDNLHAPLVSTESSDGTIPRKGSNGSLGNRLSQRRLSRGPQPTATATAGDADTLTPTGKKDDAHGHWLSDWLFVGEADKAAAKQKGKGKKKTTKKKGSKGGKKQEPKDLNAKTDSELDIENKRRLALGLPEITESDYLAAKNAEDTEDAKAFVASIKSMTGLWDDDPMDSHWLHLERTNRKKGGIKEPMGKCCIGIQIWPADKALLQPVGNGRSDPNNTPYCPPPVGRMKFSLNPFVMGMELFGPKVCCYIICFCVCAGIILLLVFCQPVLNILIALTFN